MPKRLSDGENAGCECLTKHHKKDCGDAKPCIKVTICSKELEHQVDTTIPVSGEFNAGSVGCRHEHLSALLNNCSHDELLYIQDAIEPLLKRDFFLLLPLELSLRILAYLTPSDLLNCAKVSRHWNSVSSDKLLWHRLCQKQGFDVHAESNLSTTPADAGHHSEMDFHAQLNDSNRYDSAKMRQVDWKFVYRRNREIQCNWRHGTPWAPVSHVTHKNHLITCLEIYNDWAITGSDDSRICIWSLSGNEQVVSLAGHLSGVWSLAVLPPMCPKVKDNSNPHGTIPLLVSGSCDRTARVWLLDGYTWLCIGTLIGHRSTVRCISGSKDICKYQLRHATFCSCPTRDSTTHSPLKHPQNSNMRLVVTGSRDSVLRLWVAETSECLREFRGHTGAVRCVQFVGNHLVSGSYDCTVRLWCVTKVDSVYVLRQHTDRVYTLIFDGFYIISASLDTTICVWDASTGNLVRIFFGHRSLTSEMAYCESESLLVSSNADETARVWNIATGSCVHILAGPHKHRSAVTCVQLTKHFVISSSDDGTCKLWDRHSGLYIRDLLRLDGAGIGGVIWKIVVSNNRLICAAGSRNGMEQTKLIVLHFDELMSSSVHVNGNLLNHICQATKVRPIPSPKLGQIPALVNREC